MHHIALAIVLIGAVSHAQPEPTHEGTPMSEWVELMDQNPGNHRAVTALGEIGEPALPHLIEAMRTHPDGAIRFLTQTALAKIGEPALPELDRIMVDGDSTARIQAILAFEKILGKGAIGRLEAATGSASGQVRARAHGALLRLGQPPAPHVEAMVELLFDTGSGVQWITAESLGWCGEDAAGAEDALYEVTQRFEGSVADRAWQALEEIGTEAAMAYVYERWARDFDDPNASRSDSLRALIALGKAGEAGEGALPLLREIIADRERDILIRGYAAWAEDQIDPYTGEPRTFHVDQNHPAAADDGPGTEHQPWRSIQVAAETMRAGDTVLIHDGLYREEVRPFMGGTADRPITYAAAPGEAPVITGSDVWETEWTGEEHHIFQTPYERHAWDHPEEWPTPKDGPMHRAEQVFVNGDLMKHVATMDELRATPSSILTDDEQGRLYLHTPLDAPHADLLIERSMRQQVFAPAVRGLGHIHVRGLTMRHAAAPESNGSNWGVIPHRAMLSVRRGHHWVIESNVIEWGNAQGLDIGGEGFGEINTLEPSVDDSMGHHIARRNTVSYHGVAGIVGWAGGTAELLLEDNVTNHNCRKGNFWQYEAAGIKLHNAKDCIIRRHRAHGNHAFGIWLDHQCERNRITQCILTSNMAAGIFHEVSAGPILIDSNVIIGTREARPGEWGDGVYSHDGNRAIVANNFVFGCEGYGIRFRNLFSRVADGMPTTTSNNRIFGNVIADCDAGPISLNPDVPRAENNTSDQNVIWHFGRPIAMRLEDSGSGIRWEETEIGEALGGSGGGNLDVPLGLWQDIVGHDANSILAPAGLLFEGQDADRIVATLQSLWPADQLDTGYAEASPRPATEMIAALVPELAGWAPIHEIRLGPDFGLALWEPRGDGAPAPSRAMELRWLESSAEVGPLSDPVLANAPLRPARDVLEVATGDELTLEADAGLRVVIAGLPTEVVGDRITTSVPPETPPGDYGVVTTMGEHWQWAPIRVTEPFGIVSIAAESPTAVAVALNSHLRVDVDVEISVTSGGVTEAFSDTLAAGTETRISMPIVPAGATPVDVTVSAAGSERGAAAVLSFARATCDWDDAPSYSLADFPGGAFPEGAEAFALFQGGLTGEWQARHDDEGLELRVVVQDSAHLQTMGPDELWQQDSVQLLLAPTERAPALEIDLALPSDGGGAMAIRRQSPDEARCPLGSATDLAFSVARADGATTYEASIPWEMIGLEAPPESVRMSLLVNSDDGRGRYGLQWFFGIHGHRGDQSKMGTLWVE